MAAHVIVECEDDEDIQVSTVDIEGSGQEDYSNFTKVTRGNKQTFVIEDGEKLVITRAED